MTVDIDWTLLDENPRKLIELIVEIDASNLNEELRTMAELFATVSEEYEDARVDEATAKWRVQQRRHLTFQELREAGDGMPVGAAEKLIDLDKGVEQITLAYFAICRRTGALRSLFLATQMRHDMLIQISSRQKAELSQY